MKNRKIIENEVLKVLQSKDAGVITLSGEWGCGKTHLWKEIEPKLESPVYVSLFGCSDSGDLKRKIFTSYLNRTVKNKEVKDVINSVKKNSIGSVLETSKIILKGLDSFFGTNLLTFNTDVLNFVESSLIFCIDDIERIGTGLSIQEVFGVIDFLANQKSCKILLVLNEENLKSDEGLKFQSQIEKISRKKIKVEADVSSIFDTIIFSSRHKEWFQNRKKSVLDVFIASGLGNIRTMIRLVGMYSEILDEGISISSEYAKTVAFYLIEQSSGQLKGLDDYNFSGGGLTLGWGDDGTDKTKKELLRKYFNDFSEYKFSEEIYKFVDRSYFDKEKLKAEIDPSPESLSDQEKFVRLVAGYDWYAVTQSVATDLSSKILAYLLKEIESFTARQSFVLVTYLEYVFSILGNSISVKDKEQIIESFRKKGGSGDTSIDSNLKLHYSSFNKYWSEYAFAYSKGLERFLESIIVSGLMKAIENEDINAFVSLAQSNISKLHFLSDNRFELLEIKRSKNLRFYHLVVDLLIEFRRDVAGEFKGNYEIFMNELATYLEGLASTEKDPFAIRRFSEHLKKIK